MRIGGSRLALRIDGGRVMANRANRFCNFPSRSKPERGTWPCFLVLCLERWLGSRLLLRLRMNRLSCRGPRVSSVEMIGADFGLGLTNGCKH